MNDNRVGTLVGAIGLAILLNSIVFLISFAFYLFGIESIFWFVLKIQPALFVLITAIPYARSGVMDFFQREDTDAIEREKNRIELERLRLQYQVIKMGDQTQSDAVIDGDSEKQRLAAWRKFWIKVLERCRDHNSVISWRDADGHGLDKLMKYQTWYETIALPFIRQGWMTPVFQGGKSKMAVSVILILDELSAGRCPTAPFGDPPVLATVEHFESQANAYQNTQPEFEHA